ncbi:37-kD nucleoid-associated bacterial protein [Mariniflexile rhizosphaerae]|uniref:nucleoid-associated protein n=1 Tax=unclassified Mariniflexile TaxID=2643887 RepID=UPI000CC534F5|nr:nucleoid-associated protein [Mariniflexile sp. TRM1-10]AXP81343.1 37-kD nucleoid-associated bacterial protein [Mariniflexile sp. TRM1-10]PLB17627.1 MAG: 37-kD nucleoid-associated bacterial protein [Flavobacteriaceae bacterium FS1-H7996/R]
MISRKNASISKFIIHKVGNKFNDTKNAFSEKLVDFDEASYDLMLPFLLRPFSSVVQSYRFNHHANISLNEINSYSNQIFSDDDAFIEISKHIVTHLYEQSTSAQIKTGDVLVAMFEGIEFNDITTNALGIFKIESKVNFFQTYLENNSYDVLVQKGISSKKVDKGCLILNQTDTEGNIILSVDNNSYDAQYWINQFLNIKYADDANNHTQQYITLCKDFSTDILKTTYGAKEQNTFLAKTIDFFKENEVVNIERFKDELFEEDKHKKLFDDYKKNFEDEQDMVLRNQFDVAESVVNKEKKKFKTDIKLDTNIQIKLDIDAPDASAEYLERGYDDEKKMHYYKAFFNVES